MRKEQELEVQHGIWIEDEWIRNARLGSRLKVVVRPGEIRILPVKTATERAKPSEKGWDVFRTLGDNAPLGDLRNASTDHDRYLYRKEQ